MSSRLATKPIALGAISLLSLWFGACGSSDEGGDSPAAVPAPAPASEVDRLRALGYVEFAEEPAGGSGDGVVRHDVARAQPGINFYNQQHEAAAVLMDGSGEVLHRFEDPTAKYWARVVLLPDGDIVAVGADERGQKRIDIVESDRFIARMSWDGTVKWKHHLGAHHDVEPSADGGFITLAMASRLIGAIDAEVETRDDWLVELSADGKELRRTSLYELLAGGPAPFAFGDVKSHLEATAAERVTKRAERNFVDLLHSNSVERMDLPELNGTSPLHTPDALLVTSRHQDSISVVSVERGELLWTWGRGVLAGPHDATWLENGNLLVLDNGLGRKRSRVLEVEPRPKAEAGEAAARIVWEYTHPEPERFYTASRGSAQRLANGNTLVSNSGSGEAFEVTPGGERVWEFLNPERNRSGRRATIGRMVRLNASFVEPILARYRASGASAN